MLSFRKILFNLHVMYLPIYLRNNFLFAGFPFERCLPAHAGSSRPRNGERDTAVGEMLSAKGGLPCMQLNYYTQATGGARPPEGNWNFGTSSQNVEDTTTL